MPYTDVVDAHVHLSDRVRWPLPAYGWHQESEKIDKDFTPAVFLSEKPAEVTKVIFVECMVTDDEAMMREEARWACGLAEKGEAGVAGVVASAPLGVVSGEKAGEFLDSIKHEKLKGIRKLLQNQKPGFGLTKEYIDGVNACGARGLVVDICVKSPQLPDVLQLVAKADPSVKFVLDHMGKPSITPGKSVAESDRAWADNIGLLAQHTNVFCKVSGVITEVAGPWVPDDIEAYVSFVITAFGWGRVIYGSDWYASKLASSGYADWYQTLKTLPIISSSSDEHKKKLFKTNAEAVYGV